MSENFTQSAQEEKDQVNKGMEKAKEETTQSFKDWYNYIESHPLQSLLFGATIYFALKGFMSSK